MVYKICLTRDVKIAESIFKIIFKHIFYFETMIRKINRENPCFKSSIEKH